MSNEQAVNDLIDINEGLAENEEPQVEEIEVEEEQSSKPQDQGKADVKEDAAAVEAEEETFAPETDLAENDANITSKQTDKKKKKRKRKRGRSFWTRFSPLEWTMIILGILLGGLLIAAFSYLYNSALHSNKAIPKTGIIADDTDKSWETRVVNSNAGLSAEFAVATSNVTGSNVQVDSRVTKEAVNLLNDLKAAVPEEDVNMLAGYTSIPDFSRTYQEAVDKLMDEEDMTRSEAAKEALKTVAQPGTDEHSTGLLVNFGIGGAIDPAGFRGTQSYEWLKNNAWKYGFIERYPEGKDQSTLHGADASAFRYVGVDNAEKIYESGQTLEEYNAAVAQAAAAAAAAAQQAAQAEQQAQAAAEAEDAKNAEQVHQEEQQEQAAQPAQ